VTRVQSVFSYYMWSEAQRSALAGVSRRSQRVPLDVADRLMTMQLGNSSPTDKHYDTLQQRRRRCLPQEQPVSESILTLAEMWRKKLMPNTRRRVAEDATVELSRVVDVNTTRN